MILRFMDGPRSGKSVKITTDDYTLGRDDSCDLLLDADGVSRVHCRIKKDGDTFVLHDNKSTNGVILNGKKIEEPQTLKENDTIRISDYLMLFSSDDNLLNSAVMAKLDEVKREKTTGSNEPETVLNDNADSDDGTSPPEVEPAEEDAENPPEKAPDDSPDNAEEAAPDQVQLDFSKKETSKPEPSDGDGGIKSLLSGSTGIMLLVVIVLALILAYIILTSPPA